MAGSFPQKWDRPALRVVRSWADTATVGLFVSIKSMIVFCEPKSNNLRSITPRFEDNDLKMDLIPHSPQWRAVLSKCGHLFVDLPSASKDNNGGWFWRPACAVNACYDYFMSIYVFFNKDIFKYPLLLLPILSSPLCI